MYDLWYAMGLAIMRPTLVSAIGKPKFNFVRRALTETDAGGNIVFETDGSPSTGNIDKDDSGKARLTMANFVKAHSASAPPISLYCAGRFCQMVNIGQFDSSTPGDTSFCAIVKMLSSAYLQALEAGPESSLPSFPAFLGLMAFDATLVNEMDPLTNRLNEVLAEFGIEHPHSREWHIASKFLKAPEFAAAVQLFMEGDSNPWIDNPTGEPIFYWDDDHSSHLVP